MIEGVSGDIAGSTPGKDRLESWRISDSCSQSGEAIIRGAGYGDIAVAKDLVRDPVDC